MFATRLLLAATVVAGASGCLLNTGEPDSSFTADYQFGVGQTVTGWSASAADFPAAQESAVGFIGDVRVRPEETLDPRLALYLRGDNLSADLFMYWYRKLEGFVPNADYTIGIDVEYISNLGRDCTVGAGASTWLKAGVTNVEPARSVDQSGWYRLAIDKGQQAQGGATIPTLGNLRNNSVGCIPGGPYSFWGYTSGMDIVRITTNAAGELWLIVGTESGFAGPHDVYISRLGVRFRPVS